MGTRHGRVLASLPDVFEVVTVFDVSRAAAEALAAQLGCAVALREEHAIRSADLVLVATPVEAHAQTVAFALEEGRPVLVEKPMTLRGQAAQALARRSRALGVPLFVAHSERFNPAIQKFRACVPAEEIHALSMVRRGPLRARSELGVALNLGVHDFDLAAFLTEDEPEILHAMAPGSFGMLAAEVWLRTRRHGVPIRVSLDGQAPLWERRVQITTSRGIYDLDLIRGHLLGPREGLNPVEDWRLDEPALVSQARSMRRALDMGTKGPGVGVDLASADAGALAVTLAEAAMARLAHPVGARAPRDSSLGP